MPMPAISDESAYSDFVIFVASTQNLRMLRETPSPLSLKPSHGESATRAISEPEERIPEDEVLLPSVCRIQGFIPSFAPFLTVKIPGMEFPAQLDAGSGLSLFGNAVLERYRTKRVTLKETSTRLKVASGSVPRMEAVVRLYMHCARKTR